MTGSGLDDAVSSTVEELIEHVELALQAGDPGTAMESCQQALMLAPRNPDVLFLLGECCRDLGDLEGAQDAYRRCVLADPKRALAWAALGGILLYHSQLEEARRALHRAIREDAGLADAWYARGLLRERCGDFDGADRDLARAARLDPEGFPFPPPLSDEDLERGVEEVLTSLHPNLQEYLANVAILVEDIPSEEILGQYDPPIPPGELLGYFSGHGLMDRSLEDPWSHLPSAIILFRRNLQRYAQTHEQLVEELKTTLYHEVGHFLGLDEEQVKDRGLE